MALVACSSSAARYFPAISMQSDCSVMLLYAWAFRLHHEHAAMLHAVKTESMPFVGPARTAVPGPDGPDHQHDGTCVE